LSQFLMPTRQSRLLNFSVTPSFSLWITTISGPAFYCFTPLSMEMCCDFQNLVLVLHFVQFPRQISVGSCKKIMKTKNISIRFDRKTSILRSIRTDQKDLKNYKYIFWKLIFIFDISHSFYALATLSRLLLEEASMVDPKVNEWRTSHVKKPC
jgi:hypothetical protein